MMIRKILAQWQFVPEKKKKKKKIEINSINFIEARIIWIMIGNLGNFSDMQQDSSFWLSLQFTVNQQIISQQ